MKSLKLTLEVVGDDHYRWSLSNDDAESVTHTDPFVIDTELSLQVRGFLADPRSDNAARLGHELGKSLGLGRVSVRINEAVARLDSNCVYLSIPSAVSHFPWELMIAPEQTEPRSLLLPVTRMPVTPSRRIP